MSLHPLETTHMTFASAIKIATLITIGFASPSFAQGTAFPQYDTNQVCHRLVNAADAHGLVASVDDEFAQCIADEAKEKHAAIKPWSTATAYWKIECTRVADGSYFVVGACIRGSSMSDNQ